MKKVHWIVIGFFALAIVDVGSLALLANQAANDKLTLYYGSTCPHCKIVEDWLAEHDANSTLDIARKEVFEDQANQQELSAKAVACRLNLAEVGVPFLAAGKRCIVGDKNIITYLEARLR